MAKDPEPPSYSKVLKSIKKTGKVAAKQADKQLDFAKQWYKDAEKLNLDIVADLDEIRTMELQDSKEDRSRLENVFYDLENEQMAEIDAYQQRATDFDTEVAQLKKDALDFKSEANQKYMAGKAQADVTQAFAAEKEAAERALLDAGVNPNSGVSRSLTAGLALSEAGAKAAAGTTAADAARQEGDVRYQQALDREIQAAGLAQTGLELQKGMVDVGRTYPAQIAAQLGQAGTSGAQAIDQTVAIGHEATAQNALAVDWTNAGTSSNQLWADVIDTGFKNKLDLYNAETQRQQVEQQESSGIGGALGAVAGVAQAFMPGFADGGMVEPGFALGGAVADPSVGNTDTVPARLTVGEFVVPDNVVKWKGEQFFQNLIDKAPKEKQGLTQQTGARPKPVPVQSGALAI